MFLQFYSIPEIPPEKVMIIDVNDSHIKDYKLGPFNEGTSVNITCEATGGVPVPNVTWWLENTLLDKSMDYITIHSDDPYHFWHNITKMKVRNVLHIDKIERKSLNAVYTCQATNSQLMHPISSSITLDVNRLPTLITGMRILLGYYFDVLLRSIVDEENPPNYKQRLSRTSHENNSFVHNSEQERKYLLLNHRHYTTGAISSRGLIKIGLNKVLTRRKFAHSTSIKLPLDYEQETHQVRGFAKIST
ncbi:hypothetical protein HUJ04_004823 [Dendroctonus ponderosae]|nr:hypothetical protein HUJ04_004823 [Dendroctonus ponderosae]